MRREAAGSGTSSARGCAERDLVGRENDSTDARGVARGWRRLGETHASVGARRCAAEEDPRNQCDARLIGAQRASASFFLFRFFLHVRALSTSAPRSVSVSLVFAWRLRGNGATAAIASLPKASPHARHSRLAPNSLSRSRRHHDGDDGRTFQDALLGRVRGREEEAGACAPDAEITSPFTRRASSTDPIARDIGVTARATCVHPCPRKTMRID